MKIAVILVHYHTPELVAAAAAAVRADLGGIAAEWVVVDNGSTPDERAVLEQVPARRIDPGRNLGYAGGVNLGMAESSAELVVLMNPDVIVRPGCVRELIGCLERGGAVAGPRFWWDHGRRMMLPPAERRSRTEEVLALLAGRSERWATVARRRWRRHARRHWQAAGPLRSPWLSGSLLALRRSAWERVGPFDEGFRLFFEETDWLLRAWRLGLPVWYVPAAEAVHLYSQSASREPRAQQWFEESAQRFRGLHYGAWFAKLLTALDRWLPRRQAIGSEGAAEIELAAASPVWVEVSPNATGYPAAAEVVPEGGRWALPAEIAARLPPAPLRVVVSDGEGREVGGGWVMPGEGRR